MNDIDSVVAFLDRLLMTVTVIRWCLCDGVNIHPLIKVEFISMPHNVVRVGCSCFGRITKAHIEGVAPKHDRVRQFDDNNSLSVTDFCCECSSIRGRVGSHPIEKSF